MKGLKHIYVPGPCDHCGKPEGGFMGSTAWKHDFMCCSSECGFAFASTKRRWQLELEAALAERSVLDARIATLRDNVARSA